MSKAKAAGFRLFGAGRPPVQPLDEITEATQPIVMLPFAGTVMPFRIRRLNGNQIASLGNMSLIETFQDKIRRKHRTPSLAEMNEYAEFQHGLCRLAMVWPTFESVIARVDPATNLESLETQLAEIKAIWKEMKEGKEKNAIRDKYNRIELQFKFVFPADFIAGVLDYSMRITESGIKAVTEDMLYNAAILATRGHDNPSDHIDTRLLDPFHLRDFDNRAWVEFDRRKPKEPGQKGA